MVGTWLFLLTSKPVPISLVQGTLISVLVREKAKREECRVMHVNPEISSQVLRAEGCRALVCRSWCKAVEEPAGRVGRQQCLLTALAWNGGRLETALRDVSLLSLRDKANGDEAGCSYSYWSNNGNTSLFYGYIPAPHHLLGLPFQPVQEY